MSLSFKHILVPVDFTALSENAAAMAMAMAQRHEAKVTLMHIYHQPAIITGGGGQAIVPVDVSEHEANYQRLLESAKSSAQKRHSGVEVKTELRSGGFMEEINQYVQDHAVDLIVVGSNGRQNFQKFLLGSFSYDAISTALCSVLLVPELHAKYSFGRILLPIRNVEHLTHKMLLAKSLVEKNGSFINVLGISDLGSASELRVAAKQALKPLLEYSERLEVEISITQDSAEVIARSAQENQSDLVLLSASDQDTWKSFMAENFFKKVINATLVPLLFARPSQDPNTYL